MQNHLATTFPFRIIHQKLFIVICFLISFQQFLLYFRRYFFIACKIHCESGPSTGNGTQSSRITLHFLQRHFGFDLLKTAIGIHPHNHSPAGLQITHHISHIFIGHQHFDIINRFQNLRIGFPESLAKGMTSCQTERNFIGILPS